MPKVASRSYLVAVLMTCHNRPELTIEALRHLKKSCLVAQVRYQVFLTQTSTPEKRLPGWASDEFNLVVSNESENLFWAAAMENSLKIIGQTKYDFLLWLNDDVLLTAQAIDNLVKVKKATSIKSVTVGATLDLNRDVVTYGGLRLGKWNQRMKLSRLGLSPEVQEADLANGNIVFISSEVAKAIGGFPSGFSHSMADLYYTFQARKMGYKIYVCPGFLGRCEENPVREPWNSPGLSLGTRLSLLYAPRGLPIWPWLRLCRAIGGFFWPFYAAWPTLRTVIRHFTAP